MANLVPSSIEQLLKKAIYGAKQDKTQVGYAGEEAVVQYIMQRGWNLIARNWRPKGAYHGLELDIIATNEETLVFIEVKTRTHIPKVPNRSKGPEKRKSFREQVLSLLQMPLLQKEQEKKSCLRKQNSKKKYTNIEDNDCSLFQMHFAPAYAAFTKQKRQKMLKAAQHFLACEEYSDTPCRFDLFCIEEDNNGKFWIEHYEHVIEAGQTLDSRNTYWEPW